MRVAVPLPEFVTSRRHRVTAAVGFGVVAALAVSAATLTPAASAPLAARPVAATVDRPSVGTSARAVPTEVGTVVGAPVEAAPPASSTTPPPSGPAITALAAQGIPIVALQAYQRSAAIQAEERPACHLPWTLVAAIGAIESGHGTHAGARLYADGQDLPHVIGPVLDGTNGNAVIPDTDKGVYDGDTVYDRAVGPMQFIPSTWAVRGRDASGDGVADPFNILDAAAATGDYLCRYGTDLGTDAGRQVAVFGYNHLDSYVATVLALEAAYAGRPVVVTSTAPAAPPAPSPTASAPASSAAPSSPPAGEPAPSSPSAPTGPTPTTSAPTCPTATPTPTTSPTTSPSPLPSGCATPTDPTTTPATSAAASSAAPSASPVPSAALTPSVASTD